MSFNQKTEGSSGYIADVDANGQQLVALPTLDARTGKVRMMSETDAGHVTGTALLVSPETDSDYRLRTSSESIWDFDRFNYTAQNSSKHKYVSTTATMTWSGGVLSTNGGSSVASGVAAQLQSYAHIPLVGSGTIYCEMIMGLQDAITTNVNLDFGLMLQQAAGTSVPLDGIYFRYNSSGLVGVLNNNGTESTTSPLDKTFTVGEYYKFIVEINNTVIRFWADDDLLASFPRSASAIATFYGGSLPFGIRHHNTGIPSGVFRSRFTQYTITYSGIDIDRDWRIAMSIMGNNGIQGASGMTMGSTANYANSTVPATASLSNTAAGYTTLGGQFLFAAVAGAETDYALFAFLNPAPTTAITGRNLVITGITISTVNTVVAVATTPTILQWSIGVGSTAVSLATAEAAAARARRVLPIGTQSFLVGDLAGKAGDRLTTDFTTPLVAEPGTYTHVILKVPVGTATATEVFRGVVGLNCYWS